MSVVNLLVVGVLWLFSLACGAALFLGTVLSEKVRDFVVTGGMPIMLSVFLFMMLVTQTTGAAAHFDPRRFILFPISLTKLFLLNLLSAFAELVPLMILPSVAGMMIGLGVALHESMAGMLAFGLAALWIVALFVFVALLAAWLLAGRRRRTEIIFGLVFGLIMLGGQIIPRLIDTRLGRLAWRLLQPYFGTINEGLAWTPVGVWSFFFGQMMRGEVADGYARLLPVCLFWVGLALTAGYAVFTRLATSARAGSSGGVGAGTVAASANWLRLNLPFASEQVSAVLAKDLTYFSRNTAIYLNTASILVITLLAFGSPFFGSDTISPHRGVDWWDGFRVAFWIAYAFTLSGQHFFNLFGYDAAGFRQYLLAPLDWRRLLLGKNLATWVLIAIQIGLILAGAQLFYRNLTLGKLYLALCAAVIANVLYTLVGNFLSVKFPFRSEFGVRTRRSSEHSAAPNFIATVGMMVSTLALFALPFGLGYLFHRLWLRYLAFTLLAALACGVYALRLNSQSRHLGARRFEIAEALTRKTEKI